MVFQLMVGLETAKTLASLISLASVGLSEKFTDFRHSSVHVCVCVGVCVGVFCFFFCSELQVLETGHWFYMDG